ncbi:MAG: CBS domain-containing protein, partial [Planctomycetes bacterium]|nr:CBS domain-containing protein [Planctomycetota bacterium]
MEDDPFPSLLPATLLFAASLFGGVYALLCSPLRANLLTSPSTRWRLRSENLLAAPDGAMLAARLLRATLVTSAALLAATTLVLEDGTIRWLHLVGLVLFGGLVLDGVPSQVVQGRLLAPVLFVSPLPLSIHAITSTLWHTFSHMLGRASRRTESQNRTEQRAAQLLGLAHKHQSEKRLGSTELKMIGRLLDLPETDAATVMTPRTAITAVAADTSVADAIDLSAKEGHTRIPVYEDDLDHVLGVFHIKDVLGLVKEEAAAAQAPVRHHMRNSLSVPETVRLPALLEQMQSERVHLAIVVDEYGGTAGVVTIEDLLE